MAAADLLILGREARPAVIKQSSGAGGTRRIEREDHLRIVVTSDALSQPPTNKGKSDRFYGLDLRDVVPDQAFDPALQSDGR